MNYVVNIFDLIVDLLPVKLRQVVQVFWLYALLKPTRYLLEQFTTFRADTIYEISRTGQVIVLEDLLNDKFDPNDAYPTFLITDPDQVLAHVSLFLDVENQADTEAYLASEIPPGEALQLFLASEYASDVDFIVNYPLGLSFNQEQLEACVDKYKIAPKRYKVVSQGII